MALNVNEKRRDIQLEALDSLEKSGYNGFCVLPTGTGKGWILIETLRRLNPKKVIYLCDSELNRDETFKNDLIKWGAEEWIPKITFECYQTAYKREGDNFDLILGDEVDMAMTPEYSKFFWNNKAKHTVLVSATLEGDKRVMARKIVPIVFERGIQEIEDDGILNKANYHFVNYMLTAEENAKYLRFNETFKKIIRDKEQAQRKNDKGALKRANEQSQFWINQRSLFLKSLKSSEKVCKSLLKDIYLQSEKNKILTFCGVTAQADAICKYSYHGKNEGDNWLEKFNEGEVRVLTVCGKVDRGVNLNGVNNIVYESPSRSKTKMVQKTGRGRRLAVDEILNVYFLVAYYRDRMGEIKPTIIKRWVEEATEEMDISNAKVYKIK